jgi:release factor glutamine methyltransferase
VSRVWSVLDLIRYTTDYLGGKGIQESRLNAELLLADTLGLKRLDLYLQFDRPMKPEELADFRSRLLRRARREPLQYIAGHTDFRELRLKVDRRVLIPRPETELLVGEVLAWAAGRTGLTALDIGTGSGAIALSLATEGPFERVLATDLSEEALEVARENRDLSAPGSHVDFRAGSLFAAVGSERFDVVVSNPPYVGVEEREELEPEVRDWEPEMALFSGTGGLDLIAELVTGAPEHLHPGSLFALEVGAEQGRRVAQLIEKTDRFRDPRIVPDLTGRDRIVLAEAR